MRGGGRKTTLFIQRAGERWFLSFVLSCFFFTGHAVQASLVYQEGRLLMGTVVTLTIPTDDAELARSAAEQAFAAMERIEQCMSTYRAESELSQLNRAAASEAVPVSADLFTVISAALDYARLTDGAFDVTVGPAMEAWGFVSRKWRVPGAEELEHLRKIVGYELVRLDGGQHSVHFARDGVAVDLGGIAAGYAVDAARHVLEEAGVADAMINAGGDIYVMGGQPGQGTWNVGIRHPFDDGRLLTTIAVTNRAVATSGNANRSFMRDGVMYGHILDPRTLLPARGVVSSTVIAPTAIMADALATGVFVLGPDEGLRLLNRLPEVEGIICAGESFGGTDLRVLVSDGLKGKVDVLERPADATLASEGGKP